MRIEIGLPLEKEAVVADRTKAIPQRAGSRVA